MSEFDSPSVKLVSENPFYIYKHVISIFMCCMFVHACTLHVMYTHVMDIFNFLQQFN